MGERLNWVFNQTELIEDEFLDILQRHVGASL